MSLALTDPRLSNRPWKFTHAQRAGMVRDYVAGVEPLSVIAERYGCSKAWPGLLARRAGFPKRKRLNLRFGSGEIRGKSVQAKNAASIERHPQP